MPFFSVQEQIRLALRTAKKPQRWAAIETKIGEINFYKKMKGYKEFNQSDVNLINKLMGTDITLAEKEYYFKVSEEEVNLQKTAWWQLFASIVLMIKNDLWLPKEVHNLLFLSSTIAMSLNP